MTPPLVASAAWHLGGLHPFEQAGVLVLAFGPFVVLGVVVALQRRRAVADERAEQDAAAERETEAERAARDAGDERRGGAGPA